VNEVGPFATRSLMLQRAPHESKACPQCLGTGEQRIAERRIKPGSEFLMLGEMPDDWGSVQDWKEIKRVADAICAAWQSPTAQAPPPQTLPPFLYATTKV
jgi:hypothetical protein